MAEFEDEEEWEAVHRAADRKVPIFRQAFFDGYGNFANGIDAEVIEYLFDNGAFDAINFALPWEELRASVREELIPAVLQTMIDAADASSEVTRRTLEAATGIEVDIAFDKTSGRVASYLESEVGTLITEMTESAQATVRELVLEAQVRESSSSTLVRDIKQNIGLRTDQYRALENYREGLIKRDTPPAEINRMVEEYRERLLSQRATLIARTESMRAANFGVLEGYQQAADEGLIDRNSSTKTWVVTPDDRLCNTCRPMDGVTVPMGSTWSVRVITGSTPGKGQYRGTVAVRVPNEIHPNCRCAIKINPVSN